VLSFSGRSLAHKAQRLYFCFLPLHTFDGRSPTRCRAMARPRNARTLRRETHLVVPIKLKVDRWNNRKSRLL
jgi:hypothetical protein